MIQNCEIVVFSGSSPCEETNSIFPFGIEIANQYDKISVCDSYGTHLENCIKVSPTIIHNNVDEVEKSLEVSLKSEKEIIDHLKFLRGKNIKQAFITDGANPTYASNLDFLYRVNNPQVDSVDSTGSGDSFVAGIVYGWHRNLPFEETLTLASCLGAANATKYDVCNVKLDEAEQFKNKIQIVPLGKKMRLVDVRPT
jgi:tagatose 6-phosphate kinase